MSVNLGTNATCTSSRRRSRRAGRRGLLTVTVALIALLGVAGPALADSATLSMTDATGKPDPAAGLPRVLTVAGTAAAAEEVFVAYRATGGAPCAPTYASDPGTGLFSYMEANGAFSFKTTHTFPNAGTYMFCIWLAQSSSSVSTPITQTITFRPPTGTITATFNPVTPRPGQTFTVTVTGTSEAPKEVYAAIQRAGAPCGPTYASDEGTGILNGSEVNGSFSLQATTSQATAGQYVVCLWLAESSSDSAPIAGPQPEPLNIVAPPPPCVVPRLNFGRGLATIQRRIRSAHCTVGTTTFAHSTSVRKGSVLRLAPTPGTKLGNGATVRIVVSSGPKRRRH